LDCYNLEWYNHTFAENEIVPVNPKTSDSLLFNLDRNIFFYFSKIHKTGSVFNRAENFIGVDFYKIKKSGIFYNLVSYKIPKEYKSGELSLFMTMEEFEQQIVCLNIILKRKNIPKFLRQEIIDILIY